MYYNGASFIISRDLLTWEKAPEIVKLLSQMCFNFMGIYVLH